MRENSLVLSNLSIFLGAGLLTSISIFVLYSVTPSFFPQYFVYIAIALVIFIFLIKTDFEIYTAFSTHLYILSIVLLLLPIFFGEGTRGALRWIAIGPVTFQPSEIARPFLLLFFAKYLAENDINLRRLIKLFLLFLLPFFLIVIQPSLGVAALTAIGFFGVLIASKLDKKYILAAVMVGLIILPSFWFVLAPYQKQRVSAFLNPMSDPFGAGYNSIQSMISVGSGKLFGRGLGRGVQTQLHFLPEKHSDFVFAATAEELGFVGSVLLLVGLFLIFWGLVSVIENAKYPHARMFASGVFLVLLAETFIHVGMNMGMLPITGVPLPFVSAGGSALVGTTMAIAMAIKGRK